MFCISQIAPVTFSRSPHPPTHPHPLCAFATHGAELHASCLLHQRPFTSPSACSQKRRGVVVRCVSRCLCGRGLGAALAFSFLSAPGRRDGCAATVTKKRKGGVGGCCCCSKVVKERPRFLLPPRNSPSLSTCPSHPHENAYYYYFSFLFAVRVISTAAGLVICGEPDGLALKGLLTRLTARLIVLSQALTALPPARVRNRNGARGSAEVCACNGWRGQNGDVDGGSSKPPLLFQ